MEIDNRSSSNVFSSEHHYNGDKIDSHAHYNKNNNNDPIHYSRDNRYENRINYNGDNRHENRVNFNGHSSTLGNGIKYNGDSNHQNQIRYNVNIDSSARGKDENIFMEEIQDNNKEHEVSWREYDIATYDRMKSEEVTFRDENGNFAGKLPKHQLKSKVFQQGFFYYPSFQKSKNITTAFPDTATTTTTTTTTTANAADESIASKNITADESLHNNRSQHEPTAIGDWYSLTTNAHSSSTTPSVESPTELVDPTLYVIMSISPSTEESNKDDGVTTSKNVLLRRETVASVGPSTMTSTHHHHHHQPSAEGVDVSQRRTSVTVNGKLVLFPMKSLSSPSISSSLADVVGGSDHTENSVIQSQNIPVKKVNIGISECKHGRENGSLNKADDGDLLKESIKGIDALSIETLQRTNKDVHSIDPSEHRIDSSKQHYQQQAHVKACVGYNNANNTNNKPLDSQLKINKDILDHPNLNALDPNANTEVSEFILNGTDRLMVLRKRRRASKEHLLFRKSNNDEEIVEELVQDAQDNINAQKSSLSNHFSPSTPVTTTPATAQTDVLTKENNLQSFDTSQESTVTGQHHVEPNINTTQSSKHHSRHYSTDEDDLVDHFITTATYKRNRSVSTGNLLDIVGRRDLFTKENHHLLFDKQSYGYNSSSNTKLWLSRSCSDITSTEYSLEEILSSAESITAHEADDELESENEHFHTDNGNDSQEKLGEGETGEETKGFKGIKRRKAIRRGWKVKKRSLFSQQSISVDSNTSNSGYFSHFRDRRHGVIKPTTRDEFITVTESNDDQQHKNELVSDLLEFKRLHKQKHKRGLFLTRSVESIVKNTKKKRKRFLTGIFSLKPHHHGHNEEGKMENLRETCILADDDEEVNSISVFSGHHHPRNHNHPHHHHHSQNPPKITIIQDSAKKVSGVIELYIDKHGDVIRKIEIIRVPGQSLGFFIRFGNGIDRMDGIFISRVTLESFVDKNNLLHSGDEILQINKVDVTGHTLEQVAVIMQTTERLIIKTRSALPLPLNASPLLKSSYNKTDIWSSEKGKTAEDIGESFPLYSKSNDSSNRNDGRNETMTRTWSEPHKLNSENEQDDDLCARERSKSHTNADQQHRKLQRVSSYQNNAQKSPVYSRKLPPIPDGKIQDFLSDELHSKGFSRAQRYQTPTMQQKSLTNELEDIDTMTSNQPTIQKSPTFMLKSPRIFTNKKEKKNSVGSILSIPSCDSLSSMSDSEDSIKSITPEKVRVYSCDSTNYTGPTKGYTGKLRVAIYKLIGRISNLDAECYCTIEIDDEFKATTQLHRIKEVVGVDESFDIDIQHAHVLMFFIFHKQSGKRQDKLVSQACIVLDHLLNQQYNSKLMLTTTNHVQMRVKINFTEVGNYLHRSPSERTRGVFGFNLSQTLVKEENTIPIIVRKCVEEIEKRGLDLTGIYRISGSARKKKLLRQQFEENSLSTDVSNPDEVDCHVLAGILKDYLRELPNPLISDEMYNNIYNKATVKNKDQNNLLAELMKKLPYTNRATLIYIMDHLKKVAANCEVNKMTFQNLAVCFGPVMMSTPTSASPNISDMLDFKKQIDALEFLLSIWPTSVEHQNGI